MYTVEEKPNNVKTNVNDAHVDMLTSHFTHSSLIMDV